MLAIILNMVAQAQDGPTIIVSPDTTGILCVKRDSTIYSLTYDSIRYNVSLKEDIYSIVKTEWILYRNDSIVGKQSKATGGNLLFEAGKPGLYQLVGNVTIKYNEDDEEKTINDVKADTYVCFLSPNLKYEGNDTIVAYHKKDFDLEFKSDIEIGEWKIEWECDKGIDKIKIDEYSTLSYKATCPDNQTGKDIEFTLKAECEYILDNIVLTTKMIQLYVIVSPKIALKAIGEKELYTAQDTTFNLKVDAIGGEYGTWNFVWKENDNVLTSGSSDSLIVSVSPNDAYYKKEYSVTAEYKYNNTSLASETLEYSIYVYPTPIVEKQSYNEIVVGGREFELGVRISKGDSYNWDFEWIREREDKVLSREDGDRVQKFVESNGSDSYEVYKYTLHYKYATDNQKISVENEFVYDVKVYPNVKVAYIKEPTLEGDAICLYQDSINLGVNISGGCYEDGNEWSYEWEHNKKSIENSKNNYWHKSYNKASDNIVDDIYKLKAIHTYRGTVLYVDSVVYNIKNYPLAKVEILTDTMVITSGGKPIVFRINARNAYPDGWTYKWSRDGKELSAETSDSLIVIETNSSKYVQEHIYEVIACNHYNATLWESDTLEFKSNVWPQIVLPHEKPYETRIREGDYLKLAATKGEGGAPGGWEYKWYRTGEVVDENLIDGQNTNELKEYSYVAEYNHSEMESREEVYTLWYRNVHKESRTILEEGTIQYKDTVYRRPQKPFELLIKGGGKSSIYIADMQDGYNGLDDNMLLKFNYKFCFGYGKNVINREDTALRYQVYTEQQAKEGPWVYTYWEYSDGYVCKSDTVSYGSSRGTTSIADINENISINWRYNGFVATAPYAMPLYARIVSVNGEIVWEMQYDAATEFDESFETEGLRRGFYMVEVRIGENRKVNKIFINK